MIINYLEHASVIGKKHLGVMLELSKRNKILDIVKLNNSGVMTTAVLEGFSNELEESIGFLLHR